MLNNNQPVTKKDLNEGLNKMEKRLRSDLASKKDLKELRSDLANEITKLDTKIDNKINGLENNMIEWKDEMLKSNDNIVKEIKITREEQAAIHLNYGRIEAKVEKHEGYLVKADKKLKIGFERA